MKYISTLILLLFSIYMDAQDCRPYVPSEEGAKWEITNYNGKGKESGKVAYELISVAESGPGVTFTIRTTTFDAKGKEVYDSEFEAYCVDGVFEFDMAFKIDGGAMRSYQSMDVEVDATKLTIPSMDEKAGTDLEDSSLKVGVSSGSVKLLNMTILISDRKVEGKEELETPAGKFDCLVMTQKVNTKMIIKLETTTKEWYSEDIGMVRSESFNKKGKLMGYSELTKLER